jgi:hypothetical protein
MNAERRAIALAVLDLIDGSASDEALAERFGDHEVVADGAAYLAGFVVQALARERREPASATVALLRRSLGEEDDGDDGLGGVREPRRSGPSSGGAAAEATREG